MMIEAGPPSFNEQNSISGNHLLFEQLEDMSLDDDDDDYKDLRHDFYNLRGSELDSVPNRLN